MPVDVRPPPRLRVLSLSAPRLKNRSNTPSFPPCRFSHSTFNQHLEARYRHDCCRKQSHHGLRSRSQTTTAFDDPLLYSNKEIFLRELISNASDAADKLRFNALSDDALFEGDPNLKIRVEFDKAARTITISDNGIGMTRDEVRDHIGTIARSGTRAFLSNP